jgi:hypothetical protein
MIDDDIGRGVTVAEIIKLLKKKKIKPIGLYSFLDILRLDEEGKFGSDYVREFGYPVATYVTIEDVFNFAYVDSKIYGNSMANLDYLKEKGIDVKEFAKKQKDWFWAKYLNSPDTTNCLSENKKYPKPYVKV